MNTKENFSLKNLNTFGIDVKAKFYVEVETQNELCEILSSQKFKNENKMILGGGSNVLFTKDYDGIIIALSSNGIKVINENNENAIIEADAGIIWHKLVLYCVERNLGGIENLSLIPGKVGAAPIQNIGAYGQELKDVFVSLDGVFIDSCEKKTFENTECNFGYRNSVFKHELKNKFAITKVRLRLNKNPEPNISYKPLESEINKLNLKNPSIKDVSDIVCSIRKSKLPNPAEIGNAGSFFKNPLMDEEKFEQLKVKYHDIIGFPNDDNKIKIPAGWLIEKSGMKGKQVGNTGTPKKQALVIVNYGGATGQEILSFKDSIKKKIFADFGIELEEEVNIIP